MVVALGMERIVKRNLNSILTKKGKRPYEYNHRRRDHFCEHNGTPTLDNRMPRAINRITKHGLKITNLIIQFVMLTRY